VVASTMDLLGWLRKHLEEADADLLRELVATFVQALMGAEADAACGAPFGGRSPDRVNRRNGYRERRLDTRVGTLELAIPKLAMCPVNAVPGQCEVAARQVDQPSRRRAGSRGRASCWPGWLLAPAR
jgi:Transposase, Mutator family